MCTGYMWSLLYAYLQLYKIHEVKPFFVGMMCQVQVSVVLQWQYHVGMEMHPKWLCLDQELHQM